MRWKKTENIGAQEAEEIEETEVFFGETGEISSLPVEKAPVLREMSAAEEMTLEPEPAEKTAWEPETAAVQERRESVKRQIPKETEQTDITAETVMEEMRQEETMNAQPPRELAEVLSQEADGQISLVLPEELAVEKQLTGQMKIEDVLVEWERMKKENEEKRREEVRQHVLRQTGPMFTEFEAAVRDGLLEQLESGTTAGRSDSGGRRRELGRGAGRGGIHGRRRILRRSRICGGGSCRRSRIYGRRFRRGGKF